MLWHAGWTLEKNIYMNMYYNYPTTIYESIFAQMNKFLVEKYIFPIIIKKCKIIPEIRMFGSKYFHILWRETPSQNWSKKRPTPQIKKQTNKQTKTTTANWLAAANWFIIYTYRQDFPTKHHLLFSSIRKRNSILLGTRLRINTTSWQMTERTMIGTALLHSRCCSTTPR